MKLRRRTLMLPYEGKKGKGGEKSYRQWFHSKRRVISSRGKKGGNLTEEGKGQYASDLS